MHTQHATERCCSPGASGASCMERCCQAVSCCMATWTSCTWDAHRPTSAGHVVPPQQPAHTCPSTRAQLSRKEHWLHVLGTREQHEPFTCFPHTTGSPGSTCRHPLCIQLRCTRKVHSDDISASALHHASFSIHSPAAQLRQGHC